MVFRKLVAPLFLVALVVVMILPVFAKTPDLPAKLKGKTDTPILVNFYAAWCSTCQRLQPMIDHIEETNKGKLKLLSLDVDKAPGEGYAETYGVDGTPTYILFDERGKAVWKMDKAINGMVLKMMVERQLDKLRKVPFPANIATLKVSEPFLLLAFHPDKCKACKSHQEFFDKMRHRFKGRLAVVELNPTDSAVKTLMKGLGVKKAPSYVIVDNQGRAFLQMRDGMDEKDMLAYLKMIASSP